MLFIRLDQRGHWRGTEHRSSAATYDGTYDEELDDENVYGYLEHGISCYRIDDGIVEGLEELFEYWTGIAMWRDLKDYKDFQVTIFEGEKLSHWGTDGEDMATCSRTVAELDAVEFFKVLFETKDALKNHKITYSKYRKILEGLIKDAIK